MPVHAYPYTTKYKNILINGSYCEADEDCIAQTLDDVLRMYDEHHRAYHTRQHIEEVFGLFDELANMYGLDERDITIAALSIFYHDAIYLTDTPDNIADNEINSANLAVNHMIHRLGISEMGIQYSVNQIIEATKNHEIDPMQNPVGALVIDSDMAILGADAHRYEDYKKQIRQEFSIFPDVVFYGARRDTFLIPTVQKTRLFLTDEMEDRYGDTARDNMMQEIGELNTAIRMNVPTVYNRSLV